MHALLAALAAVLLLAAGGCQAPSRKADAGANAVPSLPPPAPPRARAEYPPREAPQLLDPSNADARLLQDAHQALGAFPADGQGFVDWVAALDRGLIAPRAGLKEGPAPPPFDLDIVMRNTREMPHVVFPHRRHAQWLDCGNCHPALFPEKAGATAILMEDIFRGRHCGTCHGRVAFPAHYACERCHRLPHGDVKAWW